MSDDDVIPAHARAGEPRREEARRCKRHPRSLARAFALALVASVLPGACSDDAPGATGAAAASADPTETGVCGDVRVHWLLDSRPKNEPFLADTSRPEEILVARLAGASQDPLTRAKEELVLIGEPAMPALERFVTAHMSDPASSARLLNAFTVAQRMPPESTRPLLLRGLEHPQESVRIAVLKGLQRCAKPADYDVVAAQLPISGGDTQALIAQVLLVSDRARAEADFCTWLAAHQNVATWTAFAKEIAREARPETLTKLRDLVPQAPAEIQDFLRAGLARGGDADALAEERELLKSTRARQRQAALLAFDAAGLATEFVALVTTDSEPKMRELAADRIAAAPDSPEFRAALSRGIADTTREVRKVCLVALVARGDRTAQDTALELLKGDRADLEDALAALRPAWMDDPALAQRGFVILNALWRGESGTPRVEHRTLVRALALIPLRESIEQLYAASASEPGPIAQLTPHHWYTQQIGNGGAPAAEFLREKWRTEADPLRRLDLMSGAIYEHDAAAREFLVTALTDPRSTPCEVLWIAEQLAQRGPTAEIAPLLKRVALSVTDRAVRPAFNALLWRWYGGVAG